MSRFKNRSSKKDKKQLNRNISKWQDFYDLHLPWETAPQTVPADVPSFFVYCEGVRAMNAKYVEVYVSVKNGIYYFTCSGGTTHMDGFGKTGVIPPEYIRNNCVVLGVVLSLTGGAFGFISPHQEDNCLIVDFSSRSVCPPKNAVCRVCGKAIPHNALESFYINGEIRCRHCYRKICR